MHPIFKPFTEHLHFTGDLKTDIQQFLILNQCSETAKHCSDVGAESRRLALLFDADPVAAETAGWLHDISVVFPNHARIDVARQLAIDVLPEEEKYPMIIHQKISKSWRNKSFMLQMRKY